MNVEPEMEFRPEVEFRQEMDIPAETCEGGLGAARRFTTDITSQYITADKPEVVISHGIITSQEASSSFPTENTQTAPAHISMPVLQAITHPHTTSSVQPNRGLPQNELIKNAIYRLVIGPTFL